MLHIVISLLDTDLEPLISMNYEADSESMELCRFLMLEGNFTVLLNTEQ